MTKIILDLVELILECAGSTADFIKCAAADAVDGFKYLNFINNAQSGIDFYDNV